MSDRIEQILEILGEVQKNYDQSGNAEAIVELRRRATETIAKKREIYYATVTDKFRNQLKPEIQNTREFDQLVISWLCEESPVLYNILIDHAISGEDNYRIESFFRFHEPFTTEADVFTTDAPAAKEQGNAPVRKRKVVEEDYRVIPLTDTLVARFIKQLYAYRCQICGTSIFLSSGELYAEAHHIKPLEDGGPDLPENVLCVCPNHHVALDYGAIHLDLNSLATHHQHRIETDFIEHHNTKVRLRSFRSTLSDTGSSPQ